MREFVFLKRAVFQLKVLAFPEIVTFLLYWCETAFLYRNDAENGSLSLRELCFCFFIFKYILLIMLLQLSHFLPFIPLCPVSLPHPHSPLGSCPWVVHVSSLASPFPILFLTSPYFVPTIYASYPCSFSPTAHPPSC